MTPAGAQFSIAYDQATGVYSVQNDTIATQFGPANFLRETSAPDNYPRVEYGTTTSTETNYLTLFKPPPATPPINFTMSGQGAWQRSLASGNGGAGVRVDYFSYGLPTPAASMPQAGVREYRFTGRGSFARENGLFPVVTSGTLRVDYGARTISIVVAVIGDAQAGGTVATARAEGTITEGVFAGPLQFDTDGFSGSFRGQLYGPQAEELGFVLSGSRSDANFALAVGGVRNAN